MNEARNSMFIAFAIASCAPPSRAPSPPTACTGWRYEVIASKGAEELAIDARIVAPRGERLTVEGAGAFMRDVEIERDGRFARLEPSSAAGGDLVFSIPPCGSDGCHLRYRFELREAAARVGEVGCALEQGSAIVTSPSAWLLHPVDPEMRQPVSIHVSTPPGTVFIAGLLPEGGAACPLPPASYVADVMDLPNPAWAAFGALRMSRVHVGEGLVDVAIAAGSGDVEGHDEAIREWVTEAATAVRGYYRRASIARALVIVSPRPGRGIGFARTLGNGGATILANVGREATSSDLVGSWELIHELLHVSFPTLSHDHAWLAEGMATYVEPLIRARRGTISPSEVFARFHERMPFGLPDGDRGLDGTRSWGRTYWGGALFCLLADLAIRERTHGERSLDDALRAVLAAGGNVARRWDIDDVVATGDAATGVPVLRELYARLRSTPERIDLDALWTRLGVIPHGESVSFDDTAELASIRRALVEQRPR